MIHLTGDKENKVRRREKSLGELCKKFVQLYGHDTERIISLDSTTEQLGVERRRIYDIINILESFDVVVRLGKNTYNWKGLHRIPVTIQRLKAERGCVTVRRDKSLGLLCVSFIQLFIHFKSVLSLKQAAKLISDSEDEQQIKTKIRRLYDIANVLTFLKLTKKTSQGNKPAYEWLGEAGFRESFVMQAEPTQPDMQIWVPNKGVSTPCFDTLMQGLVTTLQRQAFQNIENLPQQSLVV
jgi:transcription factor E2F7/8